MKTPIEYIKEAWAIYTKKENFIFFARVMAVLVIVSTLLGYLFSYLYPASNPATAFEEIDYTNTPMLIGLITVSLLVFLTNLWTQSTTYFAIFNIGSSEREIFRLGYKNMWRFFGISLVLGLIIGLGAILLIIPAIIFGVWYSFSLYLVLEKGMKIGESLKQSKLMVKGRFFKVLGRSLVFGLFSFLITLVLSLVPYAGPIAISFVGPLFLIPSYLLYKDLSVSN